MGLQIPGNPVAIVILFLSLLLPGILLAQTPAVPAASPSLTVLLSPPPSDGPIVVQIGFQLLDINSVEDQSETFEFSGILTLRWKDPRLAFDPTVEGVSEKFYQGSYQFNEVATGWYPEIVLLNVAGMMEQNGVLVRLKPDGTTTVVQAINAVAKTELNLRRYPFDHQRLRLDFAVLGYSRQELILEPLSAPPLDLTKIRVPQWEVQGVHTRSSVGAAASLDAANAPSTFVIEIDLRRKFMFVMRLVVLPLFLVVALSWSVFWMDRSSIGDRMSVSFVALLTVVAYQIVLGDILPRIAYLTVVNLFLNFSFILVCATILINLIVGELDRSGKSEVGNQLDRRCRRIFPITYLALIALAVLIGFTIF